MTVVWFIGKLVVYLVAVIGLCWGYLVRHQGTEHKALLRFLDLLDRFGIGVGRPRAGMAKTVGTWILSLSLLTIIGNLMSDAAVASLRARAAEELTNVKHELAEQVRHASPLTFSDEQRRLFVSTARAASSSPKFSVRVKYEASEQIVRADVALFVSMLDRAGYAISEFGADDIRPKPIGISIRYAEGGASGEAGRNIASAFRAVGLAVHEYPEPGETDQVNLQVGVRPLMGSTARSVSDHPLP